MNTVTGPGMMCIDVAGNFGGSSSAPKAKGACPDANLGGAPCAFTSDTPRVGSGCNDSFSSLRIR